MAAALNGVFPQALRDKILESKVLVVGAGGIGCEILKNLVLSGFPNIEIIDLDTIDLSNLNRQFLFHREHVGKSKAQVAVDSALQFNPDVKIKAYHDSITSSDYGVNFFKKFHVVLNALDNRAARNHVNRMCLNAGVPLIESGTAGYNGQVELIQKGLTQCYECTPKAAQKTFPGCTIRNTPSELIHCIVWAKHLFNQLFGETVDEEDISPDMADPEAKLEEKTEKLGETNSTEEQMEKLAENDKKSKLAENDKEQTEKLAENASKEEQMEKLAENDKKSKLAENAKEKTEKLGENASKEEQMEKLAENTKQTKEKSGDLAADGNVVRVSTRQWAQQCDFNVEKLFNKFFYDDVYYLLSMSNLWKTRKPPVPTLWEQASSLSAGETLDMRQYHKLWNLAECAGVFRQCLEQLRLRYKQLPEGDSLSWDKDDTPAMDFVAACACLRAYAFDIARKSRFEIKSMAGNIIPAIATTNAITAGVVVLQTFKVLQQQFEKCQSVYMRLRQNPRQQLLVPEKLLTAPNPNCYVCAADPAIHLRLDTKRLKIKELRDEVLIKTLNMVQPEVTDSAKGVVLISADIEETEDNDEKLLSEMGIVDGVLLRSDDFVQQYELGIVVVHFDAEHDQPLFEVIADKEQLKPKEEKAAEAEEETDEGPTTSKRARLEPEVLNDDDDDDLCLVEDEDEPEVMPKAEDLLETEESSSVPSSSSQPEESDIVDLDSDSMSNEVQSSTKVAGIKRKVPLAEPEVTEIFDSEDEEADNGPSLCKRTRLSPPCVVNSSEVINID